MFKHFAVVLLLFSSYAGAAEPVFPDAGQSLLKMQQAMELLNFQGTVAFLRNGKLDTMKYFHASVDGVNQERLVTLNSPLHEVVRNSDTVSCFLSNSAKVIVDHRPSTRSFLIDLPEKLDGLDEFYQLKFSGEEQVAMFNAWVLDIVPKDKYRYARRIWLEKQQFLPLKVEVYDEDKHTIEQVVFTEIQLKSVLPIVDVDSATQGREIEHIHQRLPDSFEKAHFNLAQIPGGFREQFFMQMTAPDSDQPVEHIALTDGFSSVSVYLEAQTKDMILGPVTTGSVNSFSRTLGSYLVTVMGEVPSATVQYIAQGVNLRSH